MRIPDRAHTLPIAPSAILILSPIIPTEIICTSHIFWTGRACPIGPAVEKHIVKTPSCLGQEDGIAVGAHHFVTLDISYGCQSPGTFAFQFVKLFLARSLPFAAPIDVGGIILRVKFIFAVGETVFATAAVGTVFGKEGFPS